MLKRENRLRLRLNAFKGKTWQNWVLKCFEQLLKGGFHVHSDATTKMIVLAINQNITRPLLMLSQGSRHLTLIHFYAPWTHMLYLSVTNKAEG